MGKRILSTFGLCLLVASFALVGPARAVPEMAKPDAALGRKVEAALARQEAAVAGAVAAIEPQRPGVRDVFFIGIAGWGDQDVFRKEVRAVRGMFEKSFGAQGRALSLVNHRATLDDAPLATRRSIEMAVNGVADVMDRDEDLLVIFLTSHGGEWDGISLTLNGQDFGSLYGAQLARILGWSQIRNRVVIVSSCFSGQFVPALAEENTLLITAAASDRASFGCSSDADWTWFGQAFFRDALPKQKRFQAAFDEARKAVERREKREGFTPSVPQIRMGANIRAVLEEMGL
jgi:hypothetical protein